MEGLPQVTDFYQGSEFHGIVMKPIPQTASILLDLRLPLNLTQFLEVSLSIINTLSKVHSYGYPQNTLTPANIWYDSETKLSYFLDFSLCKNDTGKNENIPDLILPYLSPERTNLLATSEPPTCGSPDLYSLGIIFFELLTGRLPFDCNDQTQFLHAHVAMKPFKANAIKNYIPAMIGDIIDKLLQKDPMNRYLTSHGLQADLMFCYKFTISELDKANNKKAIDIPQFPLGFQDLTDRFQISDKIYQRDEELLILKKCSLGVEKHGDVQLVVIHGAEGSGKSFLFSHFLNLYIGHETWFCLPFSIGKDEDDFTIDCIKNAFETGFNVPKIGQQILSRSKQEVDDWRELLRSTFYNEGSAILDFVPSLKDLIGQLPPSKYGVHEKSKRIFGLVCKFIKVLAGKNHPLVIAFDNMQFANNQTLQLFLTLISLIGLSHVLFVVLYRDESTHPGAPLLQAIQKCEQESLPIFDIALHNLDQNSLFDLISDSLRLYQEDVAEDVKTLTETLIKKTRGNPFFVVKFLKKIYADGLLKFDPEIHRWVWELEKIQECDYTENVIYLLTEFLQRLSNVQQYILKRAACIGRQFDTLLLYQLINKQKRNLIATEDMLRDQLLQIEDLVTWNVGKNIEFFTFSHEKIQQVAYKSLDPNERKEIHLQIGLIYLRRYYLNDDNNYQKDFIHLISEDKSEINFSDLSDNIIITEILNDSIDSQASDSYDEFEGKIEEIIKEEEEERSFKEKPLRRKKKGNNLELDRRRALKKKEDEERENRRQKEEDEVYELISTRKKPAPPYAVINHLNLGSKLIKNRNLKVKLAEYNLMTAKSMTQSVDSTIDIKCIRKGIKLLFNLKNEIPPLGKNAKPKDIEARRALVEEETDKIWVEYHDLLFELHYQLFMRLMDNPVEIEELFILLIDRSNSLLEKMSVFNARVDRFIINKQLEQALGCVYNCMKEYFGIPLNLSPTLESIDQLHRRVGQLLNGRDILSLINNPGVLRVSGDLHRDSLEEKIILERIAAQKILSRCIDPSYFVNPFISLQTSFEVVLLGIQWGFSEYTLLAICFYSVTCIHGFQALQEGIDFSKLLLEVGFIFPHQNHFAVHLYIDWCQMWQNVNIRAGYADANSQETELVESFKACLIQGDINYALFILLHMANQILHVGEPLSICRSKCERYLVFMRRIIRDFIDLLIENHLANICILLDEPFSVDYTISDEEFADLKIKLLEPQGYQTEKLSLIVENHPIPAIRMWYYVQQLQLMYMMGNMLEAQSMLEKAEPIAWSIFGTLEYFSLLFFSVLVRAKTIDIIRQQYDDQSDFSEPIKDDLIIDDDEDGDNDYLEKERISKLKKSFKSIPEEKREEVRLIIKAMEETVEKMRFWGENSSCNFANRVAIAEGELLRIHNRLDDACDQFRKGFQLSKINQFIHFEAIAHQLYGDCLFALEKKSSARAEILESLRCYKAWGAKAKEKQLEEHYRHLWQFAPLQQKQLTTSPENFKSDIQLVQESFSIIQNGVSLGGTLKVIMQNILKYSGAQSGCLILEENGSLSVEVENNNNSTTDISVLHQSPLSQHKYPLGVINFVNTRRSPVMIANASQDHTFLRDPYVQLHQTRSVLCMPLLIYTQLVGILYLENQSVAGLFTKVNISVLSTISLQMIYMIQLERVKEKISKYTPTFNSTVEEKDMIMKGTVYKKIDKIIGHSWESAYAVLSAEGLTLYQSKQMTKIIDRISMYSIQKVSSLPSSSSFFIKPPHEHFLKITYKVPAITRMYLCVPSLSDLNEWEKEMKSLLKPLPNLSMNSRAFDSLIQIREEEITLGRTLGKGSVSTVYSGIWNGIKVSVKVFDGLLFGEEDKEFFKEMNILRTLRHPNILLFLGAYLSKSGPCLVTEYMSGGNLFDDLHDKANYRSDRQKIQYLKDISNGMLYLHSFQPPIIHRDLKSPNVLIDENGTCKVADFGLARFKSEDLQMTQRQGTVAWMAPEVFEGQQYSELADGNIFFFHFIII